MERGRGQPCRSWSSSQGMIEEIFQSLQVPLRTETMRRQLDHLVRVEAWCARCFEFAHFSDRELADAVQTIAKTAPLNGTALEDEIAKVRADGRDSCQHALEGLETETEQTADGGGLMAHIGRTHQDWNRTTRGRPRTAGCTLQSSRSKSRQRVQHRRGQDLRTRRVARPKEVGKRCYNALQISDGLANGRATTTSSGVNRARGRLATPIRSQRALRWHPLWKLFRTWPCHKDSHARGGRADAVVGVALRMSNDRKPLTASEMDAMTPDQRAAAVTAGIITDLAKVPAEFRRRVLDTGQRIADQRRSMPPSA